MSNVDLLSKTIQELAPLIKGGKLSPVELVQAELEHIQAMQPSVNAFITVAADRAMAMAKEREREVREGKYRGPLHGIPFGAKDSIMSAGVRTTGGSKILKDWVPGLNEGAVAIDRSEAAGAILIGKENCREFASGADGINPHYGNIHNPWDLNRSPGGSSSGSGASVGSLQTFFSFGTDNGGSVRIPAALCGAVGFKTTYGRIPHRGAMPPWNPNDHVCPLTRSVWDAGLVLQVVAGYDDMDPTTVPVPVPDYTQAMVRDVRGLTMGIPSNFYFDNVDPQVEASVRKAITVLESLGVKSKPVTIGLMDLLGGGGLPGGNADGLVFHEEWIRTRSQDYTDTVAHRFLGAQFDSALDVAKLMRFRRLLKMEFAKVMREVDFILTPTIPTVAPIAGAPVEPGRGVARNTGPTNQTGSPSLTVPCGFNTDGLPIGVQFIGRPFEEDLVLRVGHQYEMAAKHKRVIAPSVLLHSRQTLAKN